MSPRIERARRGCHRTRANLPLTCVACTHEGIYDRIAKAQVGHFEWRWAPNIVLPGERIDSER